jgi:hypothetical protein
LLHHGCCKVSVHYLLKAIRRTFLSKRHAQFRAATSVVQDAGGSAIPGSEASDTHRQGLLNAKVPTVALEAVAVVNVSEEEALGERL